MHHRTGTARQEFRDQENERVEGSRSLAETFQELRTLTVELAHFRGDRPTRKASQIKYRVNLGNAKSVFLINCPNDQCVGGDFDLSAPLASAVAKRTRTVMGELICQGWRNSTTIDQVRCNNVLRYKLAVGY